MELLSICLEGLCPKSFVFEVEFCQVAFLGIF